MSQKSWKTVLPQTFSLSSNGKIEGPWPESLADSMVTALDHEDIVTITGQDAVKFLQGQSTCDVQKLVVGSTALGACCTPKGRMIANFRILKINEEHLCLTMPAGQADNLIASISKYAAFYKVTLSSQKTWVRFGLCTSTVADTITTLIKQQNENTFVVNIDDNRTELWVSLQQGEDCLHVLMNHAILVPTNLWCLHDIQQGIAWVTPKTSETLLPQECNWECIEGVSFKKGCYTGQEIVARLHFRGKAKSRVQHFTINTTTPLLDTAKIINAESKKVCGHVVNHVFNPQTQQIHLLASVRLDQLDQPLFLENSEIPLSLQPLPYSLDD